MATKQKEVSSYLFLLILAVAVVFMIVMFVLNKNRVLNRNSVAADPKLLELQTLGASDKAVDIENELNKTNIESIDDELK